ncbi:hypothetical protein MMC29_004980 [Sticta canariensis]|nr:hypothetical protein [Sticta canariensis]
MQASLKNRQRKVSNPPTFIWEPELLVLDPVVDLRNAFSNLFLLLPALPHFIATESTPALLWDPSRAPTHPPTHLHYFNPIPPNPADILESSESTDIIEPLETRPPTPPKRSLRRSSDERQQNHGSTTQLESVRYTLPPAPANQSQNTQQIPFTRNSSHLNIQLRPQQPEISTGAPLRTPCPLRS